MQAVKEARYFQIRGVVQGVGFRPFVFRLAEEFGVTGWVLNAEEGVEIHAEGDAESLNRFAATIEAQPPPAARIASVAVTPTGVQHFDDFTIRKSEHRKTPSVRVSADLPVCDDCLREVFDPADRRYHYPYVNCTNCGPRYSIVRGLPYDRAQTTMRDWPMCAQCSGEYEDPRNRRFHAQPIACAQCGPNYILWHSGKRTAGYDAIAQTAQSLRAGKIAGIKGLGGYHLACDARNADAVAALRERKYRKERPFAVMVRDASTALKIVALDAEQLALLQSSARPILLAPALETPAGVAPENDDLGIMIAYAPVHHLLFDAGAPDVLVMTSANRSSEPIAYRDEDARVSLDGIADVLLIGEREIARRIDDSVASQTRSGPVLIRHARGYAPRAVATLPAARPILALGADLKNAIALVVQGQAFVSQHIGDLEHYGAFRAFTETISDFQNLYEVPREELIVAHDAHPQYASSTYAAEFTVPKVAVQHHRAHVASVLAEHEAFEEEALGFAFDGTGYGEDGSIWGGEVFLGSIAGGFKRVAHLLPARLPGGDAAARFPAQAAAGYLWEIETPDLRSAPFFFPERYEAARELLRANVRVFPTTSMGRLFDTVAALLGFTRQITFEAQAAMWVEHLARGAAEVTPYPFPFESGTFDFRPLLSAIIRDRVAGRDIREIARAFHGAVAKAVLTACEAFALKRVVVSGGVFQNRILLNELSEALGERLWCNHAVPSNDGGICLGQAAIACFL